ncbi:flippase-like domain-containing protein [Candidatus Saccharibacteria bacterium]|nr:flippase-like domain-containing protein [Candidatus Saccharibacteria bacterium]
MDDPLALRQKSRLKIYLTFGTFAALIILAYGLRSQIADAVSDLGRVNTLALLLIIPLKVINYDAYARLYRNLFAIVGSKVNYWSMYRLSLEFNFVNYILPSGGISGISYFTIRSRSLGISGAKATLAQISKLLLLFISFQPLLVLGIILLALREHVNNLVLVTASSLITLLIVGTFLAIYIIESRQRINSFLSFVARILNRLVRIVRPRRQDAINIEIAQTAFNELHENYQVYKKNWRALKYPFLHTMIANITEISALYVVYIAFGDLVNIGAVILAYAVANFAGLISVLPAGIGIYEGLMTGVLVATGIPAGLSISVTIMFRLITMIIQLPPGYILYQKAVAAGLTKKL